MKKLLALVLALVMTLGLATVGSNAATELKDTASVGDDYQEAVTVVNAVEVMIGDENGNFNPSNKLTRAEGAAIAARLIATNKVAAELVGNGTKFSDVPANFWNGNGSGMIEYCAVNGILNGVGDGKFDPNGALSAVAFAKMMLTALGYDSQVEGYVNNVDWATHVMTRANRVGILKGLDTVKPTDQLTREQAAQIVFNTLKTPIVEYDQKLYTSNGDVLVGSTNAKPVSNEELGKQTIYRNFINAQMGAIGGYTVEFAEQYYPALVLKADEDDFGRPANNWTYGREQLGYWVNYDLLVTEWTTSTKGDTVYNAMGALAYKDYTKTVWVDGVELTAKTDTTLKSVVDEIKKDGDTLSVTGRGVLTQLFVDDKNEAARLVVVNTYFAEAVTDYNATSKSVNLGVYEKDWDTQVTRTAALSDENVIADLKMNDKVIVTMTKPGTTDATIQSVALAKVDENVTVNGYTSNAAQTKMTSITVEGTKYNVAAKTLTLQAILQTYSLEQLKNFTYDVWYDSYDNIIAINYNTTDTAYVFVAGAELKSSYLAYTTYTANLIWMDGTMETKTVSIAKNASDEAKEALTGANYTPDPNKGNPVVNAWFTYSKDDAGNITLRDMVSEATGTVRQTAAVAANAAHIADISKEYATLRIKNTGNYTYGNDKTVFLTVAADATTTYAGGKGAIKEVLGVATGIKNVSINVQDTSKIANFALAANGVKFANADTFYLYNNNSKMILAAVVVGQDTGANRDFLYVTSFVSFREYNGRYLDTYSVIKDGVVGTIQVDSAKSGTTDTKLGSHRLHQVVYDKDGVVVEIKDTDNRGKWTAAGLKETPNTSLNTDTNKTNGYTYNTVAANSDAVVDGNTLTIKASGNNTHYVLVNGESCKFFVYNPGTSAYDTVNNLTAALRTATTTENGKQRYLKAVSTVVDANGLAKVAIFYTSYSSKTTGDGSITVLYTSDGFYTNAQFYTPNGHEITYDEARAALIAEIQDDGWEITSWTAENTLSIKKGNETRTFTVGALASTNLRTLTRGQYFKVTYVDLDEDAVVAYVRGGTAGAFAAAGAVKTALNSEVRTNTYAAASNMMIRNDKTGKVMSVYDVPTNFNGGAMPTYDITLFYDGTAASAADYLNSVLDKDVEKSLTLSAAAAAMINDGDVTVKKGTTLTLDDGVAWNLGVNDLTILGTVEADDEATVSIAADALTVNGGKLLAKKAVVTVGGGAGDITASNGAEIDIAELNGAKYIGGCDLTVETLNVATLVLIGQKETSTVTVTKEVKGTPDVYMGYTDANVAAAPAAGSNTLVTELNLPEDGKAHLDDVFVNGTAAIKDADEINCITLEKRAASVVTVANVTTTDPATVTNINDVAATADDVKINGDNSVVLENATNLNGHDLEVSGTQVTATAAASAGSNLTDTGATATSVSLANNTAVVSISGGGVYLCTDDTITITFAADVDVSKASASDGIWVSDIDNGTTDDAEMVLTIGADFEYESKSVTISGIVPAADKKADAVSVTITINGDGSNGTVSIVK